MWRYFVKFVLATAIFVIALIAFVIFARFPIKAEYWVRELIIVKHGLSSRLASPKIIVVGGSFTLFGIDARKIEDELNIPVLNLGLHAGMRLDWLLREASGLAKQGDILVLALEQKYYDCAPSWGDWHLRNALAWYPAPLDDLPLWRKMELFYTSSDIPGLAADNLVAGAATWLAPAAVVQRQEALASADEVFARYESGRLRNDQFRYSAYNVDERGTMLRNTGLRLNEKIKGNGRTRALPICSTTKKILKDFVAQMRGRNASVFVANPVVLAADTATYETEVSESPEFKSDIDDMGAVLISDRVDVFPRKYFFDTVDHLNEQGRALYTQHLITQMRRLKLGVSASH